MNGENQLLVTHEPVEYDKELVEVQDVKSLLIILDEFMEYTSNQ